MKKIVRLTESELKNIVEKSVRRAIKEGAVNEKYGLKDFGKDVAFAGGLGAAGAAGLAGNAIYNSDEPEVDPQQQEINAAVTDEFGSPQGKIPTQAELPPDTRSWTGENRIRRAVTESIKNLLKRG
jgi:hypothetical protein